MMAYDPGMDPDEGEEEDHMLEGVNVDDSNFKVHSNNMTPASRATMPVNSRRNINGFIQYSDER